MRELFLAARFFPYWALPVTLILFELGRFFRRRQMGMQFVCFGTAGLLILLTLLWFVFRGDLHSDAWIRALVGRS